MRLPATAGLKLLALNLAAIPLLHGNIAPRREALAKALRDGGYDVAALQEISRRSDVDMLARASGLTASARLDNGHLGGHLALLSRLPITAVRQLLFTCRPSSLRIFQEQPLANEGVLMARVQAPQGTLDVYDTQLIADAPAARYVTLRLTQIFELSEMIRRESAGRPFVLLGDLSMAADAPAYRLLVDLLGLSDACVARGEDQCGVPSEDEREALDHVLLPESGAAGAAAQAALTEPIPGTNMAYSPHEAVSVSLSGPLFRARLEPDPRRRLEALMRVESAIDRMVGALQESRAKAVWIPVYGFAAALRYDRQLSQLASVRERVETERITALEALESA